MTAVKGQSSRFTAIRGLITEQNDTNFEADSMIAAENVIPKSNGDLARRKGIDITGALEGIGTDNAAYGAISKFKWERPNRDFEESIMVIHVAEYLYLFKYGSDMMAGKLARIELAAYATTADVRFRTEPCQFATIDNHLIVVNRYLNPIAIKVDAAGNVTVAKQLTLRIRVTERLTDGKYADKGIAAYDATERPSNVSAAYVWDLRNSGWPQDTMCVIDEAGTGAAIKSPIDYTKEKINVYPALSDVFFYYKTTVADEATALDTFSPWEMQKSQYSNTIPPTGHYFMNLWDFDAQVIMKRGETTTTEKVLSLATAERPYAVAAVNGHVMFAAKDYNNRDVLVFSKLVLSIDDVQECYQEADPTASEINDIVATDGGVIPLSNIPEVVHMEEGMGGIVVFTKDGIWMLTGDSDYGFSATSTRLTKVSTIGCIATNSVVKLDDTFYFWNKDGIWIMAKNEYGDIKVQNISRKVIGKFIQQFSLKNIERVCGDVDVLAGKVYYTIPNFANNVQGTFRYRSTILLVIDNEIGGFYYHRISGSDAYPYIAHPLVFSGTELVDYDDTVELTNGSDITLTGGAPVQVVAQSELDVSQQLNMLAMDRANFMFCRFSDSEFYDWTDYAAIDNKQKLNYVSYAEFMHKRDNNLVSGTNLTSVQSFFKVKEIDVLDVTETGGGV